MQLVGMFDSPYVRRVAISMRLLDLPFEHHNWSVGVDQARIAELNPLGLVPVLVLDDGEVLVESTAIVDYLDQLVGPARALIPAAGEARRRVLQLAALACGLADKARQQATEQFFRPAERRHEPLRLRVRGQMLAVAATLERACVARGASPWLHGDAITQADIMLVCAMTYASEAAGIPADEAALPALRARCARLAALPVVRELYVPFDAPVI
ncbi:glutathione S-transferase [soil metagenome]